ncbi:hypothetical protein DDB_G0293574 [Dictyostelium discoideum AX4]|uniref:Uncharacterized protein n=1 Tax=Dictyostelium discoideum TaxID=44689 RepID=Q54BL3_DICDI|nr:hypothetical protein DDB_G0293574 [Dictyostelium discoideum AX4]EAL60599.1 hypothetical protein DDB_G0293574 [Dictyostelium discoideum AX4]|eukprot:XP_629016.1 hypothetical protein DDB_G0293574 [Dictyostelium discoideum AX4]
MTILKSITSFTFNIKNNNNNNKINNINVKNNFSNNIISESSTLVHFKLWRGGTWLDIAMDDRVSIYTLC